MCQWQFDQVRNGLYRTPQEAELFKDENTEEGEYAGNDHLVREVIQNTLDAASDNLIGPVRIRIALHDESEAPSQERLGQYFSRLKNPLEDKDITFDEFEAPTTPCRFLVCEDFGTRGLEGDTELSDASTAGSGTRQDFYWFWRNIGRSGKTGDDLGRWGLGKTVFRAVSRVGTMFGLTIRQSDGKSYLMGQSVLQPHTYDGVNYQPEGYYCQGSRGDVPLPIEDSDEIAKFIEEWHLTRSNEAGTSIVSPFIPEELRADRVLQAVIVHFFTRILREQLEVEVSGPELKTILVTAHTIEKAAREVEWNGSKRMKRHTAPPLAFAKKCLLSNPVNSTEILGEKRLPKFDDNSIRADVLAQLRESFAAGDFISLRVRMALPKKLGPDAVGEMDVYLQQKPDGSRSDSYYVREGMTITRLNSRAGLRGVQAIVIVEEGPLAELLGDTEGPAHEDWNKAAERPKKTWKSWSGRVGFARRIVDNIVEYLTVPVEGPDRDLLANVFSVELLNGQQRNRVMGEERPEKGKFPPIQPKPRWYQITQRSGGFTVARNPAQPLPPTPRLEVALAYDLPRGNPLRNWNRLDFDLSKAAGTFKPLAKGLKAKLLQGNTVELEVTDEGFQFAVDGFDKVRDLYVRVLDISGANSEEASEES